MMYQFSVGFECEFLRQGFTIAQLSNDARDHPKWRFGVGKVEEWKLGKKRRGAK